MPEPAPSTGVAPTRLRELLTVDRKAAGEARKAGHAAPLLTTAYHMPLGVRIKRRWRGDRRLRRRVVSGCLALLALIALSRVPLWHAPAARAANEPLVSNGPERREAEPKAGAARRPTQPRRAAPKAAAGLLHAVAKAPQPEVSPDASSLSPRRRLQRADVWLRISSPRGAREARGLLESALGELPRSAHGHAALAQACLRLHDSRCARAAIEQAMEIRPWRAGYRVLARRIEATFAAHGELQQPELQQPEP